MCKEAREKPGRRELHVRTARGRVTQDEPRDVDADSISRASEVMLRGGRAADVGRSMTGFCFHNTPLSAQWRTDWRAGKRPCRLGKRCWLE